MAISGFSCAHYNYFGEVPEKPGQYPQFTAKDSLVGKLDADRAGYDVTFYDLDLTLDPEKKSIGGTVIIKFKAVLPLKRLRFDLYKNLKIEKVLLENIELPFERNNRAVYVSLSENLIPGNSYSMKVVYGGRPREAKKPPWKGGMVWKKDKNKYPWIGVACESEGSSIWFPCKDHLSDEPDSMRIKMSVPEGMQVVSNGLMKDHRVAEGREVFTWETHYPINVYNITFYAGKFSNFSDTVRTKAGTIKIDYYVLPQNLDTAKKHFIQTKDILRLYSELFGPYPWIGEDFKLVEAPFEGMENQTAIAYGSGFYNYKRLGGDYIIVHETAHEWWGNAVSVSDFGDIWLQEGFATYSEFLFAEHKLGYDSALYYLKYYQGVDINNRFPVVGPENVHYWNNNDNDVYNKGSLILHTIRNVINNDSIFFNILQTYYKEYAKGSHPATADFIKVVERKTGKSWGPFFDLYLNHREIPKLEFYYGIFTSDSTRKGNLFYNVPFVIFKWDRVPQNFTMPVDLFCTETKAIHRVNVTTEPKIFFLQSFDPKCHLRCNHKLSYFDDIQTEAVMKEFEENLSRITPDK